MRVKENTTFEFTGGHIPQVDLTHGDVVTVESVESDSVRLRLEGDPFGSPIPIPKKEFGEACTQGFFIRQ